MPRTTCTRAVALVPSLLALLLHAPALAAQEAVATTVAQPGADTIAHTSAQVRAAAPAAAPAATSPDTAGCRRCIAGHRYLVSSLVPDAFVTTHFRNSLGGGFAGGLVVPVRNLDGTVIDSVGGDVGFVTLDLEYQYAATPWLGVRLGSSIQARIGTSVRSLVASGAEALSGTALGVTGRVWSSRSMLVSLTGEWRRNEVYVVDPYSFAQAVDEGGLTAEAQDLLLRTATLNRFTAGARAAWTVAPWVGLNGLAEFGTADDPRPEESGQQSVSELGVSAGFDFAQRARQVPVGLTLAARRQGGSGRGAGLAGNSTAFSLGLFYTGRANFLIGGEGTWSRIDLERADVSNMNAGQVRIVTRYDF